MKRFLSVFIAIVMVLTIMPVITFAEDSEDFITIKSAEFQKVECIEGVDVDPYYPDFYVYTPVYTVTLVDGTVLESSYGRILYEDHDVTPRFTDTQREEPWGLGVHTVTANFGKSVYTFEVEVVPTPVVSISVDPVVLVKNVNGYMTRDYNYEDDSRSDEYFCYIVEPEYTVTLNNGETIAMGRYDTIIDYNGMEHYSICTTEQSYENQWDVGIHTAYIEVLGYTAEFDVEIVDTYIANIDFDPVFLLKDINGYTTGKYDFETESFNTYFHYEYTPTFTVTFIDGTEANGYGQSIFSEYYYTVEYTDDQSADDPWDVGVHKVQAFVGGYTTEFDVTVIDFNVESIEFGTAELIENFDGYKTLSPDNNEYFIYDYEWYTPWTVTMSDGTVIDGMGTVIEYYGQMIPIEFSDDQSYENEWDIGIHTAQATVGGKTFSFNVEVVESPVAEITVKPVKLIEKVDGMVVGDWNPFTGEMSNKYFRYSYLPEITATMKDGTTVFGLGYIVYNNRMYFADLESSQSYETPWTVGKYTEKIVILNTEVTYEVEVIPNPVESVVISDVKVIENTNGFEVNEYDHETGENLSFYCYDYRYLPVITVTLTDGTVLKGIGYVVFEGREYGIEFDDDQSVFASWTPGVYAVTANIMGSSEYASFDVEIIAEEDAPIRGDVNGDGMLDSDDAIYLLYYTMSPESYPVNQAPKFDPSMFVDSDDAIYLLYHTLSPEDHPLAY